MKHGRSRDCWAAASTRPLIGPNQAVEGECIYDPTVIIMYSSRMILISFGKVLLEKYYLHCHTLGNINGMKEELSNHGRELLPLRLSPLPPPSLHPSLPPTFHPGGCTFLLLSNSSLMKLAQMYDFIAEGPKENSEYRPL